MLDLVGNARAKWKTVAAFGLLGGAIAAITVLLLPPVFSSQAAFQAESGQPPALSGSLAGLATQLGAFSLPVGTNPHLMVELLTSDGVVGRAAGGSYAWKGDTLPLQEIYGFGDKSPALGQFLTRARLRRSLETEVNLRTGVVKMQVEAGSPELAQALGDTLLLSLNEANIRLRQSRAGAERDFTMERAVAARGELVIAENALAYFLQRNRNISSSPALQIEEGRLRRAADMAQEIYVQMRLQQEQAAAQSVRNTPTISTIDPPSLPVRKTRPRRRVAVMAGVAIGLALAFLKVNVRTLLAPR